MPNLPKPKHMCQIRHAERTYVRLRTVEPACLTGHQLGTELRNRWRSRNRKIINTEQRPVRFADKLWLKILLADLL